MTLVDVSVRASSSDWARRSAPGRIAKSASAEGAVVGAVPCCVGGEEVPQDPPRSERADALGEIELHELLGVPVVRVREQDVSGEHPEDASHVLCGDVQIKFVHGPSIPQRLTAPRAGRRQIS